MNPIQGMINEIRHEAAGTRKLLERIPAHVFDFKPHEKSYMLGRLAGHVAELSVWTAMIVATDGLDFAAGTFKPFHPASTEELVKMHDENVARAIAALETATPEALMSNWVLRRGEQILMEMPKATFIRTMALNHLIHHRGQLTVYLRLNDIPLPGIYGPSADDHLLAATAAAAAN